MRLITAIKRRAYAQENLLLFELSKFEQNSLNSCLKALFQLSEKEQSGIQHSPAMIYIKNDQR